MSKPIPKGTLVEGDMVATLDMRFLNALVLQGALESTGKEFLPVTMDRIEQHDVLKYRMVGPTRTLSSFTSKGATDLLS